MAGITMVFDFDKTIIDVDSDNWVIDELGFTDLFNELLRTMPWNSVMVSFRVSDLIFSIFLNFVYFGVLFMFCIFFKYWFGEIIKKKN